MSGPTRPVLRYHGGKWLLGEWIIGHFPEHRIYVEPFSGAASVLLQKERSRAEVYNDIDGDVVNVFRVLRDPPSAARLREMLELTPWARAEFNGSYEPTDDPVEQARRTVVRAFMAHGSSNRRKNRSGFRAKNYRRSQSGAGDWITYPEQIPAFVRRLRGVTIESRPAVEIILQQDTPDTLFYVDPPYVQSTRVSIRTPSGNDRAYVADMDDAAHERLAEVLHDVEGMVVLSGYPSALYDGLYDGWERRETQAFADGGLKRTEVVWLNAACVSRLGHGPLWDGAAA